MKIFVSGFIRCVYFLDFFICGFFFLFELVFGIGFVNFNVVLDELIKYVVSINCKFVSFDFDFWNLDFVIVFDFSLVLV